MANMVDCMLRNLQQFVQFNLGGLISWDQVKTVVPQDGDGNVVEIEFTIADCDYLIRIESPDFNPRHPLGRILANEKPVGPIDQKTWERIAAWIREDDPARAA